MVQFSNDLTMLVKHNFWVMEHTYRAEFMSSVVTTSKARKDLVLYWLITLKKLAPHVAVYRFYAEPKAKFLFIIHIHGLKL
ncbi:hypothetical protein TorRG33x02_027180 [Trema orientale]|uniref:Uncharacterized protein n=1 Tax=Trema orientale TaxID=63057 RepID=A0A2P5FUE6_TREOI|nr:hypothetical protein TorRG33x02_027180 [Trema orientale]